MLVKLKCLLALSSREKDWETLANCEDHQSLVIQTINKKIIQFHPRIGQNLHSNQEVVEDFFAAFVSAAPNRGHFQDDLQSAHEKKRWWDFWERVKARQEEV